MWSAFVCVYHSVNWKNAQWNVKTCMNLFLGVIDMSLHNAFCLKTCIFNPRYVLCTLKKVSLAQEESYITILSISLIKLCDFWNTDPWHLFLHRKYHTIITCSNKSHFVGSIRRQSNSGWRLWELWTCCLNKCHVDLQLHWNTGIKT